METIHNMYSSCHLPKRKIVTPWAHAFVKALVEPSREMVPTELKEFPQHSPEFAQPHPWGYWKLHLSWEAKLHQGAHRRSGTPAIDPAPR